MKILAMPFRNEVEILEVKLATLGPLVDRVVIAEGAYTFSGQPRKPIWSTPAIIDNPIVRLYEDKIEYILDTDMINADPVYKFGNDTAQRWGLDVHLRNSLGDIVSQYDPDDICILTDADEIPDPDWVVSLNGLTQIEHTLMWRHCYHVNWRAKQCRLHEQVCRAFPVRKLDKMTMEDLARAEPDAVVGHPDRGFGWHFTFMGGEDAILQKLNDFAHGEYDKPPYTTPEYIEQKMFTGKDLFGRVYNDCIVIPDSKLPPYLVENKDRFKHLWSPNA